MNQRIILYERVQEEYDQYIEELLQLGEEGMAERLHELILKTMILDLIIEEMYTEDELNVISSYESPLETLYYLMNNKI